MKYNCSISIATPVNKDSLSSAVRILEGEFREIAKNVTVKNNTLNVKQIRTSVFNSGNRRDTTAIELIPNAAKDGYAIEVETCYKKTLSFYFWDYSAFLIGVVLCFAVHAVPGLLFFWT